MLNLDFSIDNLDIFLFIIQFILIIAQSVIVLYHIPYYINGQDLYESSKIFRKYFIVYIVFKNGTKNALSYLLSLFF